MNRILIIVLMGLAMSCGTQSKEPEQEIQKADPIISESSDKIKVLNFATFHMGSTSDETSVEFDEEDKKNQQDAKEIAKMISRFQPSVICVEVPLDENDELNTKYHAYLKNPEKASTYYGEVGLVAFEVGRVNNIQNLHGIDHRMSYNYNINEELKNVLDSVTFGNFKSNPFASIPELNVFEEGLSLMEKLERMNHPKFLDFLITANADILTYIGTENGFEGADEAAKYYQRNLRIYSNLNRLPLKKTDRVFILSGGSHTAFLNGFLKRSLKYEVVNTFDYLK
ncbi:DUF5694 domain-containing protein [uncultured Allomuricauda sp.]|uniref:DUF5694 domain-containing protein n=1 Tax=Flagellimonas sp. W118 TaxID=3410791 RepID=UPI00261FACFA|nr:DUF5694 domain-containing protein [uncultured Allomuricauda sp.]